MATIPNDQKILTSSSTVNTTLSGSESTKEQNTWYTMQDIKDSTGPVYKVYRALLTQEGTDAPTAIVFENTLGGTPIWTRSDAGIYNCTLAGAFIGTKTHFIGVNGYSASTQMVFSISDNDNEVQVVTTDLAGTLEDDRMYLNSVEIKVYN